MTDPGIPTRKSHGKALTDLMGEANSVFIQLEEKCRVTRLAMAAGAVGDDVIAGAWLSIAGWEADLNRIRRAPDFHAAYARYRGLAYTFDCTDDINAGTDRFTGLPDNHEFKVDQPVQFLLEEGALTGGLSEGTNYWIRDIGADFFGVTTTEGGGANVNLTNATGRAELIVNIKPNYASLRTAVDAALDEIEANLTQRAASYNRAGIDGPEFTWSTRTSGDTAQLRTDFSDVEALIDIVAA